MKVIENIYLLTEVIFLIHLLAWSWNRKFAMKPILINFIIIIFLVNIICYIIIHVQMFIGGGGEFNLAREAFNLIIALIAFSVVYQHFKYKFK